MGEGGGLGVSPNYLWWQRVGAAWPDEVKRRKRHRLLYHVEEVFLAEYFARQAPARVLEFGCGFGRHLRYLAGIEQLEVHGFDQSETLLGEMQGWAPPGWVEERIRVGAPLAPLPYRDGEFDVVFTVSVLIHNRPEHLERVLRELVRVCRGHLLLIENVPVGETGLSSDEHDGCWLHPLQRHFARMGLTCEPLPSCFVEHGVYRVRVDPAARVADLHPTTLENLRRMQEEMAGFFETSETPVAVRLAEMTADRDRLWEEVQRRYQDYEEVRASLASQLERLSAMLYVVTAERDRLSTEVQQLAAECRARESEAHALADRVRWLDAELGRVVGSRSFRLTQSLAASPPAQLARRAVWWMKDHLHRDVRVRATGRRSPESAGAEVWVLERPDAGAGMRGGGHWRKREMPDGSRAWMADGQGTLVVRPGDGVRLRLRAHPAGGIADLRFLGRIRQIDLYRAKEAVVEVDAARGEVRTFESPALPTSASSSPSSDPLAQSWRETLERFRSSGQDHLAICPAQWLGVATAVRTMFRHALHVPELLEPAAVDAYADVLLESGARKIVFGGFARGYDGLVQELKRRRPTLKLYVAWYGNAAQHNEDYSRWAFNTIHTLAEAGLVTCVGHTKVGLEKSLRHCQYPVRTLLLWYPRGQETPAEPIADGQLHLGVFTAGSGWRKNVYNQISAAALIERHALHLKVAYSHELEWARIVKANLSEVFDGHIPEETFHQLLGRMHCNLYVTFSENGPLLPLESLGLGTVSVIGPAGHLFRDHAYLRDRLIAPYPDDPVVIAEYAHRAIADREQILQAYAEFCREYIPAAERSVEEFLAVE